MSDRPPVRYDEEGKSLPERGSGRPALEAALSSQLDTLPGEPEKLVIPAVAVEQLLQWAIRFEVGNAWWQGFVLAHGVPSWIENGQWRFSVQPAEVVKRPPPASNGALR